MFKPFDKTLIRVCIDLQCVEINELSGFICLNSTVAVRITDNHFRHSECYTCTDCGLNLKMRGHFWVGDVMYCEKHAKERHQGLVSTQAMVIPRH